MKAAVCRQFARPLAIEELDLAAPGRGEAKVRIAACAVCHSDLIYLDGGWGGALPAVAGHEAAGIVEAVGPDVRGIAPGDHVVVTLIRSCGACFFCARDEPQLCEAKFVREAGPALTAVDGTPVTQGLRTGAFAECVLVDSSQLAPIPRELPLDRACLLACGVITGLGAVLRTAAVPAGSHVATIGVGGVGLNCIQGARLCGAATNIAVDIAGHRLETARGFGATHTIDATAVDARDAIRGLTGGRGADYVFVAAGSPAAIEQGATLIRRGGTLVVVGMTAEGVKVRLEALDLADHAMRILGSKMGSVRPAMDIPMLAQWYLEGRLKLDELVSRRYPLAGINDALAAARSGDGLRNVIVP